MHHDQPLYLPLRRPRAHAGTALASSSVRNFSSALMVLVLCCPAAVRAELPKPPHLIPAYLTHDTEFISSLAVLEWGAITVEDKAPWITARITLSSDPSVGHISGAFNDEHGLHIPARARMVTTIAGECKVLQVLTSTWKAEVWKFSWDEPVRSIIIGGPGPRERAAGITQSGVYLVKLDPERTGQNVARTLVIVCRNDATAPQRTRPRNQQRIRRQIRRHLQRRADAAALRDATAGPRQGGGRASGTDSGRTGEIHSRRSQIESD